MYNTKRYIQVVSFIHLEVDLSGDTSDSGVVLIEDLDLGHVLSRGDGRWNGDRQFEALLSFQKGAGSELLDSGAQRKSQVDEGKIVDADFGVDGSTGHIGSEKASTLYGDGLTGDGRVGRHDDLSDLEDVAAVSCEDG